ncbi:MAG: hypothetical protein ACT6FD_07510 [Methanosarcinaceae archaeon]
MSEEFLLRFYTVHKKHSSQMKKLFEINKGYILHLDGSAEAGDEITWDQSQFGAQKIDQKYPVTLG